MEIERKFLLKACPPADLLINGDEITQGYLLTGPAELRIRRRGSTCFLTVKSPGTLVRSEWEVETPPDVFLALWPLTEHRRIEKRRYTVPYGYVLLEIDEYLGHLTGLYIVEVEFESETAATNFSLPAWLDGAGEVTEDDRYKNRSLAQHGLPLDSSAGALSSESQRSGAILRAGPEHSSRHAPPSIHRLPREWPRELPTLAEAIGLKLNRDKMAIIDGRSACASAGDFRQLCLAIAGALGELVEQNADGDTLIEVYDRRAGRIQDGVRYHQTRQGGDIHTDAVNHPVPFRYTLLGCVAPAILGGETIVALAGDIAATLAGVPDVLATLRAPFWFEGRGMGNGDALFQMPVLSDADGTPRFRYLRSYIESAHARANQPLTPAQLVAFDALDAALESSQHQQRLALTAGQLLIWLDSEVFHGRTAFLDGAGAVGWAPRRHMYRLWVR